MSHSFWFVSASPGVTKPGGPEQVWRWQYHSEHSKRENEMTIPKCTAFIMTPSVPPSCRHSLLAVFSFSFTVALS